MWIEREISKTLTALSERRPAIILTGCRQAGKTSLLRRAFPTHHYVSLDLPAVAETAKYSGSEFLAENTPPLVVDEVQYAPELLRYIKIDVDNHREDHGRYLITGSQHFSLMQGVTESLAGRSAVMSLHSLSAREFQKFSDKTIDRAGLIEWMFLGGYPEVHASGLDPQRFYSDYLVTYLERDVRSVLQVKSLRDFDRFLRLCAGRTGQLLSYSSLAADVGVSPNTIKSWMSVLEASNIIYLLEPYHSNLGKRIVKTPKLYFLDTGLACHLLGMRHPADLAKSSLLGSIFETHTLGQLVRHFTNHGLRPPLYFYRDRIGHEVDFLLPAGDSFELIECKWATSSSSDERGFANFRTLVSPEQIRSETIITASPGKRRTASGVIIADSVELDFLQGDSDRSS